MHVERLEAWRSRWRPRLQVHTWESLAEQLDEVSKMEEIAEGPRRLSRHLELRTSSWVRNSLEAGGKPVECVVMDTKGNQGFRKETVVSSVEYF